MELVHLGLSHRTASVDVRAGLAASLGDVAAWLASPERRCPDVAELFVVSTCHRFELYAAAPDVEVALARMAGWCGIAPADLSADGRATWVVHVGVDAAAHLCRVAAGLDSLIVGEAEIAGQVRRAATTAREAGTLGPYLERVVAGALRAVGRARSETRIGEGVLSAASAGVQLVTDLLGTLEERHVLVIGAGQAAKTALGRLAREPIGRLSIASRSARHAHQAAEPLGANVWTLDDVSARLAEVDVVVAAIQADPCIVTHEACQRAHDAAPGRTRVLVDLSMPRVIEPASANVPGVRLFSVDDLGDIAAQSAKQRAREVPLVEAIARDEARRAYAKFLDRRRYERRQLR